MIELTTHNTHLYVGSRLKADATNDPASAQGEVMLLFSDGNTAAATLSGGILTVEQYRTGAGTNIPQKRWRVQSHGEEITVVSKFQTEDQ